MDIENEANIEIDLSDGTEGSTTVEPLIAGAKGDPGKNLEFDWEGTRLGIRQEGDTEYQYQDLKGDVGDRGEQGRDGAIQYTAGDNITIENNTISANIHAFTHETWTFTLEDDTTVDKEVVLW